MFNVAANLSFVCSFLQGSFFYWDERVTCLPLTRARTVVGTSLALPLPTFLGAFSPFLPRPFGMPNVMALEKLIPPMLRLADESHLQNPGTRFFITQAATECAHTDEDEKPAQLHSAFPFG